MVDTHLGYPESLVKHCIKNNYIYVDLNKLTFDYYNALGEEETKELHLIFKPNEYERFKDGSNDNSHYSLKGAKLITKLALNELKLKMNDYNDYFINYEED